MIPSDVTLKKILCPTDFSDCAAEALRRAATLAARFNARLSVLHVFPNFVAVDVLPYAGLAPYLRPSLLTNELRARLESELAAHVSPYESTAGPIETCLTEGDPATDIRTKAEEIAADLLVMGTHGRGRLDRFILGSVTEKLVRSAPCPVLTLSPPVEKRPMGAAAPFDKILCAVDLGPSTPGVLSYALTLAEERSQIVALHVVEGVGEAETEGTLRFSIPESAAFRDALVREARERLQRIVPQSLRARCAVTERVVVGRAYKSILKAAATEGVDLIVVGLHGHGDVQRLFFGGTANHVVRQAPCPVLTVRPMIVQRTEVRNSINTESEAEHAAL